MRISKRAAGEIRDGVEWGVLVLRAVSIGDRMEHAVTRTARFYVDSDSRLKQDAFDRTVTRGYERAVRRRIERGL